VDRLWTYYGNFQSVRGRIGGLPQWARGLVLLAALPGIVLAALSFLAFLVSILALLLLTVPVYRLMQAVTGRDEQRTPAGEPGNVFIDPPTGPRKRVESTVIDPSPGVDET
jgi:uncharacterized protein (DUF58 family)